ncbi:MAG TPA: hypothetical protein VF335_05760, partial [Chitinivibrionales bacterium]
MLKNNFVRLSILTASCVALFCSNPFKPSTDLGQNIINGLDSSITNIDRNIKTFKTTAHIDSAFSRCDVQDSIPQALRRAPTIMMVGQFDGGSLNGVAYKDTALSYIEFRPSILRQAGWEIVRNPLKDTVTYVIDKVIFQVQRYRDSVIVPPATTVNPLAQISIDLFSCRIIRDSVLFSDSAAKPLSVFSPVSLDSLAVDSVYSDTLDAEYLHKIKSAVSDTGTDTAWFAFCLKPSPNNSGIARFYGNSGLTNYDPRLVVNYHKKTDSAKTVLTQTIPRHHASVSFFGTSSGNRTETPVSFSGTNRRSVLKLDVSALKRFMEDSASAGKNFKIIQRADLSLKTAGIISDLPRDSLLVYYSVFDKAQLQQIDFKKVNS